MHEKNAVKKPKSATASWKHSGPASSSSSSQGTSAGDPINLDQLKREGYLAIICMLTFSYLIVWARTRISIDKHSYFMQFSVRQEIAYQQGASQAQERQKVLQSAAEVRHVPLIIVPQNN